MPMEDHSIGDVGEGGMLPISAGSPEERRLRTSKSGSNMCLRLAGLGIEMELRPGNLGELLPEKAVGEEEKEEKELSPYGPGGEGEEARIRTACQTCWEARFGTSESEELELLWKTSLLKVNPGDEGGFWPLSPGGEGWLLGADLPWVAGLQRTKPGVVLLLWRVGPSWAARLPRVGLGPDARPRRTGPGGLE